MNKINRKLEYALMGLKHMRTKQPGELTTVKEISAVYGCPFEATSKVMQVLSQKGLVRSEQGAHGGYQLIRDLNRISVYELMEAVVGPVEIARCLQGDEPGACELRDSCNVVSPVSILNRKLIEFYRGLMLGELLDSRPQTRPSASAGEATAAGMES